MDESIAAEIVALMLQVKLGDHNNSKLSQFGVKNLEQFLSKHFLEILNIGTEKQKAMVDTIVLLWTQLAGTSAGEAKARFLTIMRGWTFFGAQLFLAEQRKKPKEVLIAITKDGIFILDHTNAKKNVVQQSLWSQIKSWRSEAGKIFVNGGNALQLVSWMFTTPNPLTAMAISLTLDDYMHTMVQLRLQQAAKSEEKDSKDNKETTKETNKDTPPSRTLPTVLPTAKERLREARLSRMATIEQQNQRMSSFLGTRKDSANSGNRQSSLLAQTFSFEGAKKK